ncbi:uncharacterized protein [Rutidosis leptorrhynchoides]|uniref:uncharacterized protein n=1 Tax=Rutidosis leptorrhynchoides TaxID=125765 RepID=UPI003A99E68E
MFPFHGYELFLKTSNFWECFDPLYLTVNKRDRYNVRIQDNISIAEYRQIYGDEWPEEWKLKYPVFDQIQVPMLQNREDMIKWVTRNGDIVNYSTGQVWCDLRCSNAIKDWHHIVWFSQMVPKHAFILWLAIWNRLSTQDRMSKWNLSKSYSCALCDEVPDSVAHLFFECSYSRKVWEIMKTKLLFKGLSYKIGSVIEVLEKYPFKKQIWSVINRIVIAAIVYYIWQERNSRIFKGMKRDSQGLSMKVQEFIKVKLLTLKVKHTKSVQQAGEIWQINWNC